MRVSGVTVDITERKRAEERQNLLAREVDHRAKNALALAQSIVRLTRGETVKAYVQAVEGRISALARVHTILSLSSWQGAEIGKLVDEELAPYATGDQIAFRGSDIQLQPATAQTLALALHELVTNSAKYGALSTLAGRLSLNWAIQARRAADDLGRDRRPAVEKPASPRLRHQKRDRQHRVPARRTGRVRLALRRADLPAVGSADARRRGAKAHQPSRPRRQRQRGSAGRRASAGSRSMAREIARAQKLLFADFPFGMPSIGHSSVPAVGRVIASTISRVPSGSAIHFL